MQVATLFRETATLLGASMESGGGNSQEMKGPTAICSPSSAALALKEAQYKDHRFKLMGVMNAEPQDDGYETSADLMLNGNLATAVTDTQIKCESVDIKCEPMDDPYSFVDDEPVPMATAVAALPPVFTNSTQEQSSIVPLPRKRGRKKKIKMEPGDNNMNHLMDFSQEFNPAIPGITPVPIVKERKKHDRFNGMPEEEVSKRTLPDHLTQNLDIIIIGINPGLFAAYKGHHYAGPGNHFWKCLYLSGLTPEQMSADEDYKLLQVGIGFTNMVQRATKGSADLTRKEIKEGSQILLEKLQRFKPKIAVFNGKLIYEVFSGKKDFSFGRQPDLVDGTNTYMWVMPSSSARCAQLPRAADKVPFYAALKKFRDYLNGIVSSIDDSEVVFSDARLKTCYEAEFKSEFSTDIMDISNSTVKRDENGMPCKKKRGRPKKIKVEGEEVKKPPPVRRTPNPNAQLNSDGTKKKRGRPKKIKSEEKIEPMLVSEQTNSSIREHFSSPSPVQSPVHFCHLQQMTPPGTGSNGPYNNNGTVNATPQQMYNQSPRPQSQPFTHSDLSSEISAAISSEHLGSPAPTSPGLGPPDFDPPTSMPTEDTTECCFSSPTPSTASEHQQPPSLATSAVTYPSYNAFNPDVNAHSFVPTTLQDSISRSVKSEYKTQDMASKSLSGLESLVDQIPSIADGDSMGHGVGTGQSVGLDVAEHQNQSYSAYSNSPSIVASNPNSAPYHYSYPTDNGLSVSSLANQSGSFSVSSFTSDYASGSVAASAYPNHLMSPGSHPFIEHHVPQVPAVPVPLSYHHAGISAYGQQYAAGYASQPTLHVPSPNYPYYNSGYGHGAQPGPAGPTGYLPNHHVFDRIKPDTGYGGF